ncbi:hypothetical protein IF2G_02900 [Cordyceps javanica]|nr:hypothetical protein IF2G_02900 [Cordyceps javanica]
MALHSCCTLLRLTATTPTNGIYMPPTCEIAIILLTVHPQPVLNYAVCRLTVSTRRQSVAPLTHRAGSGPAQGRALLCAGAQISGLAHLPTSVWLAVPRITLPNNAGATPLATRCHQTDSQVKCLAAIANCYPAPTLPLANSSVPCE